MNNNANLLVAVIAATEEHWIIMQESCTVLDEFGIDYERLIIDAHLTPKRMEEFAKSAETAGFKAIIAGDGMAAHLPGMLAGQTIVPVYGVPMDSGLGGIDSLVSIRQMPAGIPVATFAIGVAGAKNAALWVIQAFAMFDKDLAEKMRAYRKKQTESVAETPKDEKSKPA